MKRVDTNPRSQVKYKGARRRMRLLMVALVFFMGWAAVTLWDQMDKVDAKNSELEILESQLSEVQNKNQEFQTEIDRLHDPEYIEQRIRKDLQMTREGEILFFQTR